MTTPIHCPPVDRNRTHRSKRIDFCHLYFANVSDMTAQQKRNARSSCRIFQPILAILFHLRMNTNISKLIYTRRILYVRTLTKQGQPEIENHQRSDSHEKTTVPIKSTQLLRMVDGIPTQEAYLLFDGELLRKYDTSWISTWLLCARIFCRPTLHCFCAAATRVLITSTTIHAWRSTHKILAGILPKCLSLPRVGAPTI